MDSDALSPSYDGGGSGGEAATTTRERVRTDRRQDEKIGVANETRRSGEVELPQWELQRNQLGRLVTGSFLFPCFLCTTGLPQWTYNGECCSLRVKILA